MRPIFGAPAIVSLPETLDRLAAGKHIKEVAFEKGVSVHSLRDALKDERKKVGARTLIQLVAMHVERKVGTNGPK